MAEHHRKITPLTFPIWSCQDNILIFVQSQNWLMALSKDVICRSPQDVALSLVMMTMVCTAAGYVLTRSFNQQIETHV